MTLPIPWPSTADLAFPGLDDPGILLAFASIEVRIMIGWYEVQPLQAMIASFEILWRQQGLPLPRLPSWSYTRFR